MTIIKKIFFKFVYCTPTSTSNFQKIFNFYNKNHNKKDHFTLKTTMFGIIMFQ